MTIFTPSRYKSHLVFLRMLFRHAQKTTRPKIFHGTLNLRITTRLISTAPNFPFSNTTRPSARPRAALCSDTSCYRPSQHRGAKREATLSHIELLQGVLVGKALSPQDDTEPEYSPVLQQVRNNMLKFSHCVLVTRIGGFYEVCKFSAIIYPAKSNSYTSNMRMSLLHF